MKERGEEEGLTGCELQRTGLTLQSRKENNLKDFVDAPEPFGIVSRTLITRSYIYCNRATRTATPL